MNHMSINHINYMSNCICSKVLLGKDFINRLAQFSHE